MSRSILIIIKMNDGFCVVVQGDKETFHETELKLTERHQS